MGGNGTAFGITGGNVPLRGPNRVTEPDTTVFGSTKVATNGLGRTQGGGKNKLAAVNRVMAMSGDTPPQFSDGGSISGTWHVVTTVRACPWLWPLDTC